MPETPTSEVRYLAPAQVAELLTIEVDEVIRLVHEGELRGARLGSPARWRIEQASLESYIESQVERARVESLWEQANSASFAEVWGNGTTGRPD